MGRFDLLALQQATARNVERIKMEERLLEERRTDVAATYRVAHRECRMCYYGSPVSGQGFTGWMCRGCDKRAMHQNTRTPILCDECSDRFQACHQCGADLDLKMRRKLEVK